MKYNSLFLPDNKSKLVKVYLNLALTVFLILIIQFADDFYEMFVFLFKARPVIMRFTTGLCTFCTCFFAQRTFLSQRPTSVNLISFWLTTRAGVVFPLRYTSLRPFPTNITSGFSTTSDRPRANVYRTLYFRDPP